MPRLTTFALGAVLALGPAVLMGQDKAAPPAPIGADYSHASKGDAYSGTGEADRAMPDTTSGWVEMILAGGLMGGAGLALRRLTAR